MSSLLAPGSYQHKPLNDARSIRVLLLEPAPTYGSTIRCSLVEVTLDTIDESDYGYTALSYVWGYKKGDREIICDGKTLLVTRNCEKALRTLRDKNVTELLWVDAICIDQTTEPKGLQERSHQIKLMGEIYRSAVGVVVWLGDSDPSRARAMEHIERVAKYDAMEYNGYYLQRLYAKLMVKRCIKRMWEFSDNNFDSEGNSPLLPILRSPWILRVWTVQEVAFAQSCAVVFGYESGYYLLSWGEFSRAMTRLVPIIDKDTAVWAAGLALKELLRREMTSVAGKRRVPTDTRRVLDILELLHHMQATESRDMVYAIYPILEFFGVTLSDPDYSKPVETIYEEMTRSIMIATQSLEQFRFVCTCARNPNLPSWVPDWQDENHLKFGGLSFESAYGDSSPVTAPGEGKIAISGREIGKVRMRATRDCRMEGRMLKAEKEMKVLSSRSHAWYRANIPLIQTLKEWLQFSTNHALDCNDYLRTAAFLETLLLGAPVTSETRKAFEVWLSIIQYPRNCKYDLSGAIQYAQVEEAKDHQNKAHWTQEIREALTVARAMAFPKTSGHKGRSLPHAAALEEFHDRLYDTCRDKAFFITEDGRMGTCFHTVEAGDVLVLFKGTREGIVLRQAEENYLVVGPAYVVGLIDLNVPLDGDMGRMRKDPLLSPPVQEFLRFTWTVVDLTAPIHGINLMSGVPQNHQEMWEASTVNGTTGLGTMQGPQLEFVSLGAGARGGGFVLDNLDTPIPAIDMVGKNLNVPLLDIDVVGGGTGQDRPLPAWDVDWTVNENIGLDSTEFFGKTLSPEQMHYSYGAETRSKDMGFIVDLEQIGDNMGGGFDLADFINLESM